MDEGVEVVMISGRRELWVDGWTVPLVTPVERDGGMIDLILDHRLGHTVDAANFEQVARLLADTIAVCWGYGAHPRDADFDRSHFARLPHPSLGPRHMVGIEAVPPDITDQEGG